MSRIARSNDPLYVTRGRPFSFPMRLTNPESGTPLDLTGATVAATIRWTGVDRLPLQVNSRANTDGRFTVAGTVEQTANLPLGNIAELLVTITDSQGGVTDYVYPIQGETP